MNRRDETIIKVFTAYISICYFLGAYFLSSRIVSKWGPFSYYETEVIVGFLIFSAFIFYIWSYIYIFYIWLNEPMNKLLSVYIVSCYFLGNLFLAREILSATFEEGVSTLLLVASLFIVFIWFKEMKDWTQGYAGKLIQQGNNNSLVNNVTCPFCADWADEEAIMAREEGAGRVHCMRCGKRIKIISINKSIRAYKRAIRIYPESIEAHYSLGVAYTKLGSYEKEVAYVGRKRWSVKRWVYVHRKRHSKKPLIKTFEKSVDAYKDAIRENPDYAEAHLGLGDAYARLAHYDETKYSYNYARIDGPPFPITAPEEYVAFDLWNKAAESYQRAIRLNAENVEAHFGLGNSYTGLGRFNEATEAYNHAIRINPEYGEAHYGLGNAYRKLGALNEAVEAYNRAVVINPGYAEAHYKLGLTYLEMENRDATLAEYDTLEGLNPELAEDLFYTIDASTSWMTPAYRRKSHPHHFQHYKSFDGIKKVPIRKYIFKLSKKAITIMMTIIVILLAYYGVNFLISESRESTLDEYKKSGLFHKW